MATFTEPFTTSLALTWASTVGGGGSVSVATGGTQGTMSGQDTRDRAEHDVGSADMFSELTWVSGGGDRTVGPMTRFVSATPNGYALEVNEGTDSWQLRLYNSPSPPSSISGSQSRTITLPITVRLESEGTSHRCYLDGVLVGTYTDSTFTTAQRGGIAGYFSFDQPRFDNFSTGNLVAATRGAPAQMIRRYQPLLVR